MACGDQDDIELGPLGINYLNIYYCQFQGIEFFAVLLFLLWTIFLIYLLGNTADSYFSPTLGSICEKLKIPYQVAGVTFLAFGNGSPDVFASITSFTGGQDVLIGVGALLGASMFVGTVVVGSVTIIAPCKVNASVFIRDICFFLIAVSMIAYVSVTSSVTFGTAMSYLALYFLYVCVVIVGWWFGGDDSENNERSLSSDRGGGVQAAFWHAPSHSGPSLTPEYTKLLNSDREACDDAAPYSFLILGDPSHSRNMQYKEEDGEGSGSGSDDEFTVNLSGGLITPQFDHEIVDDYFATQSAPAAPASHLTPFDGVENGPESIEEGHSGGGCTKSSLFRPGVAGGASSGGSLSSPLLGESPVVAAKRLAARKKQSMFMNSLYWQQWQMRRHVHKRFLTAEWWGYPLYMKVFAFFETPFNIIRDITVPTIDQELWYKPYSVLQPLFSPLLILYTMGMWKSRVGGLLPAPLVGAMVGVPLAAFVFLTTHHSRPPAGVVYSVLWVLMAFVMCVTWIYLFAGELVACLQAVGIISGIPPGVLGLTILAWGNSVGDLFANMAVAKQGLGEMAIAGSYGGPVFNLCLGLGISFSYVCSSTYPEPFELKMDSSSVVSLVFIYVAAFSTIAVTVFCKFEMTSHLGYFLIGLYALYTIVQLFVLLFA